MGSLTLLLGRASLEKLAEDADRHSWCCFRKGFIVLVHFISAKQNISTYYLVMAAKVYILIQELTFNNRLQKINWNFVHKTCRKKGEAIKTGR